MSMSETTIKCPICGQPYKVYAFSAADQSACPSCVQKAEQNASLGRSLPKGIQRIANWESK